MSVTIRIWFCVTVAIVAAALADPLIEFASNAGYFGPGPFTDHSNLDVLPALCLGALFILALAVLRARSALSLRLKAAGDTITLARLLTMLPLIFVLQLAVLFGMETLEQVVVYGHGLGAMMWLGGPVLVSLCVHAAFAVISSVLVIRSLRAIAHTVVRLVCVLRTFTMLSVGNDAPHVRRLRDLLVVYEPHAIACRIGERAPPFVVVR